MSFMNGTNIQVCEFHMGENMDGQRRKVGKEELREGVKKSLSTEKIDGKEEGEVDVMEQSTD